MELWVLVFEPAIVDASLSTSALESALMSNTTNMRSTLGTSRLYVNWLLPFRNVDV